MDRSKARRELGWDLIAAERHWRRQPELVSASRREPALRRRELLTDAPRQSPRRARN